MEQSENEDLMDDKKNVSVDPLLLGQMSKQLQNILAIRGDLSLKVAKRVTFITRFNMIVFGSIAISFLLFMIIMATKINTLTNTVNTMNTIFINMTNDMLVMQKHVAHMESKVSTLPAMQKDLVSMEKTMHNMDNSFTEMQNSLNNVQNDVDRISNPIEKLNQLLGL